MFVDPQSITISGSAKTLNRTGSSEFGGMFATADRALREKITHQYGRRVRHTIRLESDTLVANPLVSGQNVNQSATVFLTVDVPNGYDTATAKALVDGFAAYLAASSGAAVTKLLGGES